MRLKHNEDCRTHDCEVIRNLSIISHPEFDPENLTNDIALIKLPQPVELNNLKISPICLPFGIEKVPNAMTNSNLNLLSHFISLPECYTSLKNFNTVNNSSKVKLKPLYEDNQFCAQTRGKKISFDATPA